MTNIFERRPDGTCPDWELSKVLRAERISEKEGVMQRLVCSSLANWPGKRRSARAVEINTSIILSGEQLTKMDSKQALNHVSPVVPHHLIILKIINLITPPARDSGKVEELSIAVTLSYPIEACYMGIMILATLFLIAGHVFRRFGSEVEHIFFGKPIYLQQDSLFVYPAISNCSFY